MKITLSCLVVGLAMMACAAQAQTPSTAKRGSLGDVCAADIRTHCTTAKPGGGELSKCMVQNASKLSEPCRNAMAKLKEDREKKGTTPRT